MTKDFLSLADLSNSLPSEEGAPPNEALVPFNPSEGSPHPSYNPYPEGSPANANQNSLEHFDDLTFPPADANHSAAGQNLENALYQANQRVKGAERGLEMAKAYTHSAGQSVSDNRDINDFITGVLVHLKIGINWLKRTKPYFDIVNGKSKTRAALVRSCCSADTKLAKAERALHKEAQTVLNLRAARAALGAQLNVKDKEDILENAKDALEDLEDIRDAINKAQTRPQQRRR